MLVGVSVEGKQTVSNEDLMRELQKIRQQLDSE